MMMRRVCTYSTIKCLLFYLTSICFLTNIVAHTVKPPKLKITGTDTVNISLVSYNSTYEDVQTFELRHVIKPFQNVILNLVDLPKPPASFVILQVHSYLSNIILSYNITLIPKLYVNGTNIGLVQAINSKNTIQFYVMNPNSGATTVLIAAQVYTAGAPIPGGCNMEFQIETTPYQRLKFTDSVIMVDVQPASIPDSLCEEQTVIYEAYHMYLPEQDYSTDAYFDGIKDMLTASSIAKNGRKVPIFQGFSTMRKTYSAYHGTGSVFAFIATSGNFSSAYVPIVSYACSGLMWDESCEVLTTSYSKLLAAVSFFLGLFTCYFGHKFFKTEMFLLGFMFGGVISFIVISLIGSEPVEANIFVSSLIGIAFGIMWLLCWWYYGIPVISTILANILLGFLIASLVYYTGLGDGSLIQNNINFWALFGIILCTVSMLLTSFTQWANILTCCILGAYAVIIPVDHYIGANLKYIVVNIIRRATDPLFQSAVIDPPYQIRDFALTLLWVAIAISGFTLQCIQQRGRPPFPPPPYLLRRHRHDRIQTTQTTERSALLLNTGDSYDSFRSGSDVFIPR